MSTATDVKPPEVPSWFKGRQCKLEMLGPDLARVTAPNLAEAYLQIQRAENLHFAALLRLQQEGEPVARTEAVFESTVEAWDAAFELYRQKMIY